MMQFSRTTDCFPYRNRPGTVISIVYQRKIVSEIAEQVQQQLLMQIIAEIEDHWEWLDQTSGSLRSFLQTQDLQEPNNTSYLYQFSGFWNMEFALLTQRLGTVGLLLWPSTNSVAGIVAFGDQFVYHEAHVDPNNTQLMTDKTFPMNNTYGLDQIDFGKPFETTSFSRNNVQYLVTVA